MDEKNLSEQSPDELSEIEQLQKAWNEFSDEIIAELGRILDRVLSTIQRIVKIIIEKWNQFLGCFSNKKVKHLALHAKKKRTRKKNQHRLVKNFIRMLKEGGIDEDT